MIENALKNFNKKQFDEIKDHFTNQNYLIVLDLAPKYLLKNPKNHLVIAYMGISLFYVGSKEDRKEAIKIIQKAIDLNPNDAEVYSLYGLLYRDCSASHTLKYFQKALSLDKNCAAAYYGLGVALFALGDIEKGIDAIFKSISLEPNLKYIEDLNHFIYYDPRFKNPDYKKVASYFYLTAKEKYSIKPIEHDLSRYDINKKPLRIGFFNGENVNTPTWPFLEKIIKNMDQEKFLFYCYSKPPKYIDPNNEHPDVIQIKKHVHKWTYCDKMSVHKTAQLIYDDQIDILLDLSGYLPSIYSSYSIEPTIILFMHKPAPVQISWYGFWGTTGIPEIDYLITSKDNAPPEQDHNFTEKIYRLQRGYTHAEIYSDLPEIDPVPAFEKNGYITFTSFSRSTKLNNLVFDLWSEILKKVPNSKFLIKYFMLEEEYLINFIKINFERRGVDPERILIDPRRQPRNEFFAEYNKTDIALEPVPFGGVTTTINSLTMGVPTIAKYEIERIGNGGSTSLLRTINCPELVANSDEEYINKAVALANDTNRIKEYRANLRDGIAKSGISAEQFTQDLQQAFLDIWEDCCITKNPNQQISPS